MAFAAHTDHSLMLVQNRGMVVRGVLHSAIGMMHQPHRRFPFHKSHTKGGHSRFRVQRSSQHPSNHSPRKSVEYHRQRNELGSEADAGDVGDPELVDSGRLVAPARFG